VRVCQVGPRTPKMQIRPPNLFKCVTGGPKLLCPGLTAYVACHVGSPHSQPPLSLPPAPSPDPACGRPPAAPPQPPGGFAPLPAPGSEAPRRRASGRPARTADPPCGSAACARAMAAGEREANAPWRPATLLPPHRLPPSSPCRQARPRRWRPWPQRWRPREIRPPYRTGRAERSGLGGPSAMTGGARGGQARRQAERAAGQAAARQAAEVRARAAGWSAAGGAEATAARPSPAPAVSTSGARSSCSRARRTRTP